MNNPNTPEETFRKLAKRPFEEVERAIDSLPDIGEMTVTGLVTPMIREFLVNKCIIDMGWILDEYFYEGTGRTIESVIQERIETFNKDINWIIKSPLTKLVFPNLTITLPEVKYE